MIQDYNEVNNKVNNKILIIIHFIYQSLIKFILEVLGEGGAIWGFTEYTNIRTKDNEFECKIFCICIVVIFFIRWCTLIIRYQ